MSINLMENIIKTPTYSEAINRSETPVATRSQPPSGVSEDVRRPILPQDAVETITLSRPSQKTQQQDFLHASPVIINHGRVTLNLYG